MVMSYFFYQNTKHCKINLNFYFKYSRGSYTILMFCLPIQKLNLFENLHVFLSVKKS